MRTAWAATGSSMAAVRTPSTWSTTGPVSRTPASLASGLFADEASAVVSWRRWRVCTRSFSPSSALGGGPQLPGEAEHRVDLLVLAPAEQVDRPSRDRRLLQLLHLGGELLVADALVPPGLRISVNESAGPA